MKEKISIPIISLIVACLIWGTSVKIFDVPSYVMPSPYDVIFALIRERSNLLYHGSYSIFEAIAGLIIASTLAFVFAILMDRFHTVKLALYPLLVITQTIPLIVLAPLLVIYVGMGIHTKIIMVVLMCFFPIAISTTDGMGKVNQKQVDLVKLFGAKEFQVYTLVKIPAALDDFFSGLKVAATYSLTGAIVGEWLASVRGLGYYMIRAKNGFMLDNVFACLIVVVLASLFLNVLVKILQFWAMPYLRKG